MFKQFVLCFSCAALIGLFAAEARAALIIAADVDETSPGLGSVDVIEVGNSPEIDKTFEHVDTIDIEFTYDGSFPNGNTHALSENVTNSSGTAWDGYVLLLGTGTGDDFSQTVPTGLFFTTKGGLAHSAFGTAVMLATSLTFSDGSQGNGATAQINFSISVPNPVETGTFTLRQIPIAATAVVPEPGSLALLAIGSLCSLGRARRRRRAVR